MDLFTCLSKFNNLHIGETTRGIYDIDVCFLFMEAATRKIYLLWDHQDSIITTFTTVLDITQYGYDRNRMSIEGLTRLYLNDRESYTSYLSSVFHKESIIDPHTGFESMMVLMLLHEGSDLKKTLDFLDAGTIPCYTDENYSCLKLTLEEVLFDPQLEYRLANWLPNIYTLINGELDSSI